jgi:hypothetical protein
LRFSATRSSRSRLHRAEQCSNTQVKWHVFDTRCSGDVSPSLKLGPLGPGLPPPAAGAALAVTWTAHAPLLPLIGGVTSQISTPSHRKTIGPLPLGLGPDRVCSSVASVSRLVWQTRKQQPRNGRTTLPNTASARLMARGQFLVHEETGDAPTASDLSPLLR